MRRTLYQRVTAILMALVFLLSGAGELFGAHVCPQHDPIVYQATHGEDDGQAAAHRHHEHPASSGESQDGHEHCTCLGVCPTSAPAGVPAEVSLTVAETLDWVPVAPAATVEVVLPAFIPYFLPYAQAPPLFG